MSHVREQTQKLRNNIIESFYEEGLSYTTLSKKYGRSEAMVRKILSQDRKENGPRDRNVKPVDPRILGDQKAISFRHFCIGMHVSRYLTQRGMSPSMFGMQGNVNMSRVDVRRVETGAYDLTLTQLDALAEVLEVTVEDLVQVPKDMKEERLAYAS